MGRSLSEAIRSPLIELNLLVIVIILRRIVHVFCLRVAPLVDGVGEQHTPTAHEDNSAKPETHLGQLSVTEQVQTELDAQDELGEGDHEEDPGLGAESLASGVSDIGVVLADGRGGYEARHQDPGHSVVTSYSNI